jgi:O-succinylbenzoic acid--CoA ligase
MKICWENSESLLLLNPCYSQNDKERFQLILKAAAWPSHIWLSTSGSSALKWVGLSKHALLTSAAAVNRHLESSKEDRWVNALPSFHVGGLGIWARAYLSGAKVYDFKQVYPGKWSPEEFFNFLVHVRGTLTSLVPAQLYDLVTLGWKAPTNLRAVIIGGGALLHSLYEQATILGWPLLPSYGMSECASQVATAALESWNHKKMPSLQLLTHLQGCTQDGRLCFAGPSLLSAYAYFEDSKIQFVDPKSNGWFKSEDCGSIHHRHVNILGRADEILKVGGENVDLARLETHLQTLRMHMRVIPEVVLIGMGDDRLGHTIHLASDSPNTAEIAPLIQQFQQTVLPFERIRKVYLLKQLPRTSLGKILRGELRVLINSCEAFESTLN